MTKMTMYAQGQAKGQLLIKWKSFKWVILTVLPCVILTEMQFYL